MDNYCEKGAHMAKNGVHVGSMRVTLAKRVKIRVIYECPLPPICNNSNNINDY